MKRKLVLSVVAAAALVSAALPTSQPQTASAQAAPQAAGARNVILFVGDGMSMSTITAARILEGQLEGGLGEGNALSFEAFKNVGLVKTYNLDRQVPDSAGTMTAMMSGQKTDRGLVNVDKDGVRGDCDTLAGNELTSWIMQAETMGLATGVVTTARLTHATAAATYAVSVERDFEDDGDLPAGCSQPDIARQLIEFPYGDGLEVALGGGRRNFTPNTMSDVENTGVKGFRLDGRNLAAEWAARPDAEYVWDQAGFNAIDPAQTKHLLGLFDPSHMEYELNRANDAAGEPSLTEMTELAIEMLSTHQGGFALVVEAGRIDHAHHATRAQRALTEAIELSNAVARTLQLVDLSETLIVVTADHGHSLTISGYASRGNDILGLVDTDDASDGLPYLTLNYATGSEQYLNSDGTRVDLSAFDTSDPGFKQPAAIPSSGSRHTGEDVPLYARGPRAGKLRGVFGQGKIGRVILTALELYHGA